MIIIYYYFENSGLDNNLFLWDLDYKETTKMNSETDWN